MRSLRSISFVFIEAFFLAIRSALPFYLRDIITLESTALNKVGDPIRVLLFAPLSPMFIGLAYDGILDKLSMPERLR